MSGPIRTEIIVGSVRPNRFADQVIRWITGVLEHDLVFDARVFDPRESLVDPFRAPDDEQLAQFRQRMSEAEAFILVVPEYNHGYPGDLKNVIDAAKREWQAKPFAFVAYGGMSGGMRAVEQLKPVLNEVQAVPLRDAVYLRAPWEQLNDGGQFAPLGAADAAVAVMLARLRWWAEVLGGARRDLPYDSYIAAPSG